MLEKIYIYIYLFICLKIIVLSIVAITLSRALFPITFPPDYDPIQTLPLSLIQRSNFQLMSSIPDYLKQTTSTVGLYSFSLHRIWNRDVALVYGGLSLRAHLTLPRMFSVFFDNTVFVQRIILKLLTFDVQMG